VSQIGPGPRSKKIRDALNLLPDEETACSLLCQLLHLLHTEYFCDGDRHRSALELADTFTELAAQIAAHENHQ
jgi:hypothetical protein